MARINVLDTYWTDYRRTELIILFSDKLRADGMILNSWKLASDYWIPNRELIPLRVWEAQRWDALITVDLAELRTSGVYVRGTEERCEWWFENKTKASLGGKKSAEARLKRSSSVAQAEVKPGSSVAQAELKLIEPNSNSNSNSIPSEEGIKNIYTANSKEIGEAVGEWQKTLDRYGIPKDAKLDLAQIFRLIKAHGIEKTKLALLGAGFEAASDKFDPKKNCSIMRLSKGDNFEKFVNLGAQAAATTLKRAFVEVTL